MRRVAHATAGWALLSGLALLVEGISYGWGRAWF